jgi:hypothetical protein
MDLKKSRYRTFDELYVPLLLLHRRHRRAADYARDGVQGQDRDRLLGGAGQPTHHHSQGCRGGVGLLLPSDELCLVVLSLVSILFSLFHTCFTYTFFYKLFHLRVNRQRKKGKDLSPTRRARDGRALRGRHFQRLRHRRVEEAS